MARGMSVFYRRGMETIHYTCTRTLSRIALHTKDDDSYVALDRREALSLNDTQNICRAFEPIICILG